MGLKSTSRWCQKGQYVICDGVTKYNGFQEIEANINWTVQLEKDLQLPIITFRENREGNLSLMM